MVLLHMAMLEAEKNIQRTISQAAPFGNREMRGLTGSQGIAKVSQSSMVAIPAILAMP
jgi:hypothetical protein